MISEIHRLRLAAGLPALHLHHGTIKFGSESPSIKAEEQLTTIRLTSIRLLADQSMEPVLATWDADQFHALLDIPCPNTSLILENCTFEVTFDSPALDRLIACTAIEGAHVGLYVLLAHSRHIQYTHAEDCQPSQFCQHLVPCLPSALVQLPVMQVTMTNCKFIGFRRAVEVINKAQVIMKDCLVDLTTGQAYAAMWPVVRGLGRNHCHTLPIML
jgi:hypothetical protein